jgi:hypothetical protein
VELQSVTGTLSSQACGFIGLHATAGPHVPYPLVLHIALPLIVWYLRNVSRWQDFVMLRNNDDENTVGEQQLIEEHDYDLHSVLILSDYSLSLPAWAIHRARGQSENGLHYVPAGTTNSCQIK